MISMFFKKFAMYHSLPFSRKIKYLSDSYFKLKGKFFYRFLFKKFGKGSLLRNPLFISYESVSVGKNVLISDDARIETIEQHGQNLYKSTIAIDDGVKIEQRSHITSADEMKIGKGTTILFDVTITNIDHEYQDINSPISQQALCVQKTEIGMNCFIGSGAKILAGTILGNHCVVGANSVVRGCFPDYCVIAGSPAKVVKRYNPSNAEWVKTNDLVIFD